MLYRTTRLLRSAIVITDDAEAKVPCLSIGIGALRIGEVIDIRGHIQVTNDNPQTIAINMFLTINNAATSVNNRIDYPIGHNLLHAVHHDGLELALLHEAMADYSNATISLCMTAKQVEVPSLSLTVNYGIITVMRGQVDAGRNAGTV